MPGVLKRRGTALCENQHPSTAEALWNEDLLPSWRNKEEGRGLSQEEPPEQALWQNMHRVHSLGETQSRHSEESCAG